ncbi:hypothetical protein BDR04DRAFT_1098612 [Suillus decipiens]|nr:hypothetical protein BDR04DRAFT_1098612 [Suillus decipiens]
MAYYASPYKVQNAPKKRCMTREELDILEPYYAKRTHPTKHEIELIARVLEIPFTKVANWFGNQRAKEARAQRSAESFMTQRLGNMTIHDTDYMTYSYDDDEHESRGARGVPNRAGLEQDALYQAARARVAMMAGISPQQVDMQTHNVRACVLAMADMTPQEVDAVFILNSFKRQIVVHPRNR